MRVLQTMAGAEHGGAEAFFVRLAEAFGRAGIPQCLVIRKDPQRAKRLRAQDLSVVELPFGGPLDLRTRPAVKREITRFKPDIVLSWMSRATAATPSGAYPLVARLGGYYDLKRYRHCDHLIGNTRDIIAYLQRSGWPAERAHYLPNFVEVPDVAPESREVHGTPTDAPLLLALGRLHRNKAFDTLLEALVAVPTAWLWLAGSGPEDAALESMAKRLGVADRVRFLGWRDDIAALLAACDVFVCPSRHEPLGNVVIEAWAARKPVVATRSAGPAALIEDDVTGILVPIDDSQSLAAALRAVLAAPDKAAGMAQAGYAAFAREFTEDAVVARYLTFFESILTTCAASQA